MSTEAAAHDQEPGGGGFDAIGAAAQMMDTRDGILTITGMCADVRRSMVDEQGWPSDFADRFSQELVGMSVRAAFQQSPTLGDTLANL
jgi:hypothetical protein